MKPNLFAFATKELSQDAFIAWFLQWADPECRQHNPALHAVATEFVRRLISLQGSSPSQIIRIEAGRQWENIDIWAEVNDSHLIIIEDKVGTGQHSDQLARYRATGESWCKEKGCELICIYIKTQSDSALNLARVANQGFAVLSRRDLLLLLESHEVDNDIYSDFRERLRQIESSESQFGHKRIGDWDGNDWKGFYQSLELSRKVVNWGYVNNPAGGFWNAVLNWFDGDGCCPYMQIEQGNLCFKVGEVGENRRGIRTRYHDLLMASSRKDMGLERPSRFGNGNYMTVAIVPPSVWLGREDDRLDLDATVNRLNHYEAWLVETIETAGQSASANSPSIAAGL
jgi:hypothetical protein